jgi:hypothetical protein
LSIKSNRLHGYYASFEVNQVKKFHKILEQLDYAKDLRNASESEPIVFENWKKFVKNIAHNSSDDIKEIYLKLGAKMTFYCTSLAWCYINKNAQISDSTYGTLVFSFIIHCFLQDNLDLSSRALRIHTSGNFFSDKINEFLRDFKGIMAFLIQCKSFVNINMSVRDTCDLFDGRLFFFCFRMVNSRENGESGDVGSFWKSFFNLDSFKTMANCFFKTLRLILLKNVKSEENLEFLRRINISSPNEIYQLFVSFDRDSNNNKVTKENMNLFSKT